MWKRKKLDWWFFLHDSVDYLVANSTKGQEAGMYVHGCYLYWYVYVYMYTVTKPLHHKQHGTQGQFFCRLELVWIQSYLFSWNGYLIKAKGPSLPFYLPSGGKRDMLFWDY